MSDLKRIEVYLVPGFLGFSELSERFDYFIDVARCLEAELRGHGFDACVRVTEVESPAGSVGNRSAELARFLDEAHEGRSPVHLIGHSTGGLDIRRLLADRRFAGMRYMARVRTAIGVATPHRGTPLATVAQRIGFGRALRVLGVPGVVRLLGCVLSALRRPLRWLSRWPIDPLLDRIIGDVLVGDLTDAEEWLEQIGEDVGALHDLQPKAMRERFNRDYPDRAGVRYADVITGVAPPRRGSAGAERSLEEVLRGWDPRRVSFLTLNTLIFRLFWSVIAFAPLSETEATREIVRRARGQGAVFGGLEPTAECSDGIVPTFSQTLEGHRILGVFASDHLDCVGHFPHETEDGGEAIDVPGWVHSGASFDGARFERLWGEVARFIAEVEGG